MPARINLTLPEIRSTIQRLEARQRLIRLSDSASAQLERLLNVEACRVARLPEQIARAEAKLAALQAELVATASAA